MSHSSKELVPVVVLFMIVTFSFVSKQKFPWKYKNITGQSFQ